MYQGLLLFGTLIIHLLLSINNLDSHFSSIFYFYSILSCFLKTLILKWVSEISQRYDGVEDIQKDVFNIAVGAETNKEGSPIEEKEEELDRDASLIKI